MPICLNCNNKFPNHFCIDGKIRNLQNRKYCLTCSPFKQHNTRKIHRAEYSGVNNPKTGIPKNCNICSKEYLYKRETGSTLSLCVSCVTTLRRVKRKEKLVEYKGGGCQLCGYNKSIKALSFHHKDPTHKKFTISNASYKNWNELVSEVDKCELLCLNCHMETHENIQVSKYQKQILNVSPKIVAITRCLLCNIDVKKDMRFCSRKCFNISNRKTIRPSKEELQNLISTNSWTSLGRQFGVSDNAVRKWAKFYDLHLK